MFGYLAIAGASLLGWLLYDSNKPKSGTTPLQNSLSGQPYQVGQKVRVPLNQVPPNLLSPQMLGTFRQVSAQSVVIQVTGVQPGLIRGNLLATTGEDGDILLPTPVPVTIPTSIVSGLA